MASTRVLLIGAGETIALVARHLADVGVTQVTVANRSLENAMQLGAEFDASTILLSEIPAVLESHDIVISSTASTLPLLGKGAVEAALKARKRRPIFMLDLAVPRDIEPQVADLPDVYLYTVDDLRGVVDQGRASREQERSKAEEIIDEGLQALVAQQNRRQASDLVVDYRRSVDQAVTQELNRSIRQLDGDEQAQRVLQEFARAVSRKIMHTPTVELREAAARQDKEFLQIARRLLGIDDGAGNE